MVFPAVEGSDFTVDPSIFTFISTQSTRTVQVSFRVDAVALEPDETFRLTLSTGSGLPSGPSVFINGIAEFAIMDRDGVYSSSVGV